MAFPGNSDSPDSHDPPLLHISLHFPSPKPVQQIACPLLIHIPHQIFQDRLNPTKRPRFSESDTSLQNRLMRYPPVTYIAEFSAATRRPLTEQEQHAINAPFQRTGAILTEQRSNTFGRRHLAGLVGTGLGYLTWRRKRSIQLIKQLRPPAYGSLFMRTTLGFFAFAFAESLISTVMLAFDITDDFRQAPEVQALAREASSINTTEESPADVKVRLQFPTDSEKWFKRQLQLDPTLSADQKLLPGDQLAEEQQSSFDTPRFTDDSSSQSNHASFSEKIISSTSWDRIRSEAVAEQRGESTSTGNKHKQKKPGVKNSSNGKDDDEFF